jgi:hypothetical protein
MKKILITLISFMLILFIGLLIYQNTKKDSTNLKLPSGFGQVTVTTAPTPTELPLPSPTPTPIVYPSLYPAYQRVDGFIKYGYINEAGEYIIQPIYDTASTFTDNVAVVSMNDQYSLIDSNGTVIFTTDGQIFDFTNGIAIYSKVINNEVRYGYIDLTGTVIIDAQYKKSSNFDKDGKAYVFTDAGAFSIIDITGKILQTYLSDKNIDLPIRMEDGYVVYTTPDTNKWGVITVEGKNVLKPIYSQITYLGSNRFAVKSPEVEDYDVIMLPEAIFDEKGTQLTDYTLYDVSSFHGDFASATDSSSTYFIGLDGIRDINLPSFDGRGELTMLDGFIRADIDHQLIYCKMDGTIFWQSESKYILSDELTVTEEKYKPNKYVLVYYPKLHGLKDKSLQKKINSNLEELFTKNRSGLKETDMLSVSDTFDVRLRNHLLIVHRNGYDYSFGAAHGMPISDYYYIDITNGKSYQLQDLFIKDSNYKEKINEIITTAITEQSKDENSMMFPENFKGIADNQFFMITDDSLIIYFYPYDIAAYAVGFPEFKIPFAELSDYINMEGRFWKSFQEVE